MGETAIESTAKRRWYQFHPWHLVVLVAMVAIPCAWFGVRSLQLEDEKKKSFVDEYQEVMKREICNHFVLFGELPEDPAVLVYPGCELRSPRVFNGVVQFGFNHPTLEEGWMAFERDIFSKVISSCRDELPEWQSKLAVARKPLIELEGNLEAQLDLFMDPSFNEFAGQAFLIELEDDRGVDEEAVSAFIDAYREVRHLRHSELSEPELEQAMKQFQRTKAIILEQVAIAP